MERKRERNGQMSYNGKTTGRYAVTIEREKRKLRERFVESVREREESVERGGKNILIGGIFKKIYI